jgi:hypothetical protein
VGLRLLVRNNPKLGTATIMALGEGAKLLLRTYEARHNYGDQKEAFRLARLYARMLSEVLTSTGTQVQVEESDLPLESG